MKRIFTLLLCVCLASMGWGQTVIYDANFSTIGGFTHSSSSPPPSAPATFDGGNYTIGYDATPGTDGTTNFFRSDGSKLESSDFGGAAYFETDAIDISTVSTITVIGEGQTVGSSVFNVSSESFQWSYSLDGGTFVAGPAIT
ncbi:MAG: hypothetical protein AAF798_13475, partial [Bacteroidota bacterium]